MDCDKPKKPVDEESFFVSSEDPLYKSVVFGAVSGTSVVLVGHPLDSIKVRLQTASTKNMFRNLYKGVGPPLMAVIPSWVAVFMAYGSALKFLGDDSMVNVALAGGFSGLFYTMAVCPFEFVKVNAQRSQVNTMTAFKHLQKEVGISGLYRGVGVCLGRDVFQSMAYYICAESLNRSAFMKRYFTDESRPFFSGAFTGLCHCMVEYPFDTIKTRMQTELHLKSYRQCITEFLKDKKQVRSAQKAIFPMLTRAVLAHGASFFVIKNFKSFMDW